MATKKIKKTEENTKQVFSIQVIHYICTNCGEEIEEVKLCGSCKAPMRVLEVKEYYGEEAHKKFDEIVGKPKSVIKTSSGEEDIDQVDVLNGLAGEDELDKLDGIDGPSKGASSEEEWKELGQLASDNIFGGEESDEEGEVEIVDNAVPKNNTELAAMLDEEEKDTSIGDTDLEDDFKTLSQDEGL